MENYSEKTYRLTAILDHQGNRRSEWDPKRSEFYRSLEGCLAQNIREGTYLLSDEKIMRIDIIQDPDGNWINRNFHTSPVEKICETENGGLEIITMRSVYRFELAEPKAPVYQDDAELIELYLCDQNYQFAAGYYYDADKQPHPLTDSVHLGTFHDSVLIFQSDNFANCVCRYYPLGSTVEFYDTIYQQQDYSRRILIHNTGSTPLTIRFQGFQASWIIQPGETEMITPPKNKANFMVKNGSNEK